MKKVLYILQSLSTGGVATVILNHYRKMINISADFIVLNTYGIVPQDVEDYIKCRDGKIFYVTSFVDNIMKYSLEVRLIIRDNEYDVVHDNNKYFGFLSLAWAKKYNVNHRIAHVHNDISIQEQNIIKRLYMLAFSRYTMKFANRLLACSEEAGQSMYGKKTFSVVNNAIEVDKYKYNEKTRLKLRKEFNVEDKFVLMMIARQDTLKRFDFAYKVFNELFSENCNAKLFLVGLEKDEMNERDRKEYEKLDCSVSKNIIFLGVRRDSAQLLNMADAFILTSEHEGFGIVAVEAQANGLPVFLSDGIPKSVKVTSDVFFLPTVYNPVEWAKTIIDNSKLVNREYGYNELKKSGYNIDVKFAHLENLYFENK